MTATALSVFGVTSTSALAAPLATCGPNDYNHVDTSFGYEFDRASGNLAVVAGDPGVTLSISQSTAFTATGTIGASASISESIVILTVNQTLNVSISAGFTKTSTDSGSWTVPGNYTNGGRLEIGTRKYSGTVTKYQARPSDCRNGKFIDSVPYNAPDDGWYFKHTKL